ncbi:metallophosphoesterase family protein [Haliangium ochraceum]|uniref:Metallophosphoesterase n=1 Tax=Haliangium ochraceum (strain DSM 14365 / JCM 11303 / SMP-2) TaxID=502025 RepID=D0LUZ6_HALO1|nr:metallophosphoesterase [Haliangium ochraceum]ACY15837.1 metallophosphoesterase [Haliangium ochraceum DSM 14365]
MRYRELLLAVASVLCASASHAYADGVFRKGPYLQNLSRSSVTLMWETRRGCTGEIAIGEGADARTLPVTPAGADDGIYEIVVSGLETGRRYRYTVSCDDESVAGEFATAPAPGMPIAFVVFGDSRSNASAHRNVIEQIRREVPDFLLGTGDMVDDGSKERQWQEFFDIEGELLRENVFYPAVGNHDRQGRGRTADSYRKYFSLPENSREPERYYAFTYASARFLVLDSNAYSFSLTDQTDWLERELQAARLDPDIEHIFVTMHHPPYSVALHGGQKELRERWTPLFERYRVTAVFSGHDHVYTRAQNGSVRYFVTGGAGAPVYPKARRPSPVDVNAVQYFERVHHYLRVQVIGRFVEISAVRVDGTLIETVSWETAPRLDAAPEPKAAPERETVAAAEVPESLAVEPGQAVGGARAGPESTAGPASAADSGASPHSAAVSPAPAAESGVSMLGKLGAIMMVFASGVLIWALRS